MYTFRRDESRVMYNYKHSCVPTMFESYPLRKYAMSLYDSIYDYAAIGWLRSLKWIESMGGIRMAWPPFTQAIVGKQISIVDWLYSMGFQFVINDFIVATRHDNLDMLQLALKYETRPIHVANCIMRAALECGHLDIIKWLYLTTGLLPVDNFGVRFASSHMNMDRVASGFGHMHILEWLAEIEYPFQYESCMVAAKKRRC